MSALPRILIAYAIAIPLALLLGISLSAQDRSGFAMIALVLFVLSLPILLKWHFAFLIFFWNAPFNVPFLPAQPHFWLILAGLSFGISWLNNLLGRKHFLQAPELSKPILFLAAVVLLTAFCRGGLGSRVLGGASYGGKSYIYIFGAILGYYALTAVKIPIQKASRLCSVYFLTGTLALLGNIAFLLGPSVWFLFYFLSPEYIRGEAANQFAFNPNSIERVSSLNPVCIAVVCGLLVRYGIRGCFDMGKPWRLVLMVAVLIAGLFSGFRSLIGFLGLLFICLFFVEGLYRTRFMPICLGIGVAAAVILLGFSDRLPLSAQRAISFLPVKVDPGVRADAEGSTEWRVEMWGILESDIPKYFFLGKGYSIDPEDLYIADTAAMRGEGSNAETARVAGDYHSGFYSIIIPLGVWGMIAFVWLLFAGTKALYQNYRHGNAHLRTINAFLLAFFIAQSIAFFAIFGAFNSQLYVFLGVLGLSVSLNGGIQKAGKVSATQVRAARLPSPASAMA